MKDITEFVPSFAGDTYHNRYSPKRKHNKNSKHRTLPKHCAKCGSTKNLDIHHTSNTRNNLSTRKGLIVLCRKCHRKYHQGDLKLPGRGEHNKMSKSFLDYNFADAGMAMIVSDVEIIDEKNMDGAISNAIAGSTFDNEEFKTMIDEKRQRDLLYVAFKLVHEGTNKNKDNFLDDELKAAEKTPINKPINWKHGEPNIGVIFDSKYVEGTEQEKSHIIAYGAIWKYKYKDHAVDVLERHNRGNLKFSMETWFTEVSCPECEKKFAAKSEDSGEVCEHIKNRFEEGSKYSRSLRNICFGGAGVVDDPADDIADGIAVAEKEKAKGGSHSMSEKTYTEQELKEAVAEAVDKAIEKFKKEHESASAIAEKDAKIGELEASLTEVQGQLAELQKKYEERDEEIQKAEELRKVEAMVQERIDALKGLDFTFPDGDDEKAEFASELAEMSEKTFARFLDLAKQKHDASNASTKTGEKETKSGRLPLGVSFASKGASAKEGSAIAKIDQILERHFEGKA